MTEETKIPTLPKKLPYWAAFWDSFKFFIWIMPVAWIVIFTWFYFMSTIPISMPLLILLSTVASLMSVLPGIMLSLIPEARVSLDEAKVRRRLVAARHYFLNKEQLESDSAELVTSLEELIEIKGIENIKDNDIINHTIDRFREK